MTDTPKQLVDEEEMQTMSVAPPDPEAEGEHRSGGEKGAGEGSGVADEDPLSAHPT